MPGRPVILPQLFHGGSSLRATPQVTLSRRATASYRRKVRFRSQMKKMGAESPPHEVSSPVKRKRKRKIKAFCSNFQQADSDNIIFGLLLAAVFNLHKPMSMLLIKECFSKFRTLLFRSETSANPIFAFLPVLLNSECPEIVCLSAEILGAAALASFEMNERVASDGEILKGLILVLGNKDKRVLLSACNAVLDLATTSFGRQKLLENCALEKLMFVFFQIPEMSKSVSLCYEENVSLTCLVIGIKEDELPVSLLNAVITLIDASDIEKLQKVPRNLSELFLTFLKELWAEVRDKMIFMNFMKSNGEGKYNGSGIRVSNLAESIFRLSIFAYQRVILDLPMDVAKSRLFGMNESSFTDFISKYWEVSPFPLRRLSVDLNKEDDIFGPFLQSLRLSETAPSLLSSVLQSMVSCLPIASDEMDMLNFLSEVKHEIGYPTIYKQDIQVLRTDKQQKREVHYFQNNLDSCCSKVPHYLNFNDIQKCGEAYNEGYTVALRGMEFRSQIIADIAETLAYLFGQPSVGANLYLTPPNCQGLACHYDDHCVFVCQLVGSKQWRVLSQPSFPLPRLYDSLHNLNGFEFDSTAAGCREFLLREGDILYIPRGFLHEAHTYSDSHEASSGFSLHLTLGIEVEPPFEWEGFAHIALHFWNKSLKKTLSSCSTSLFQLFEVVSVNLLHVAIGIIGNSDPTFRKACLAAAAVFPFDAHNWHSINPMTIFAHILDKINTESGFFKALSSIDFAVQKNEDPFQQIRWVRLLNFEGQSSSACNLEEPFMGGQDILSLYAQHKDKVEASFVQLKLKFCREVVYEDVLTGYKMLLERYRKTRKQYTNGMISLHHRLDT